MKRASKYVIPWFKVQTDLISLPKFQSLSLSDRGAVLTLWGIAYRNHSEVGYIKSDRRIVSGYLGKSFIANPKRTDEILERLTEKGWLDKITVNDVVRYRVHHWEHWQASKFDVYEDPRLVSDNGNYDDENQQVINSQSTGSQQSVASDVENKELNFNKSKSKSKSTLLRNVSQSEFFNSDLDEFEAGINSVKVKAKRPKRERSEAERSYYKLLLDYMAESWERERKLPLKSIMVKADYVGLAGLVARVYPAGFALGALQAAWGRFLLSAVPFHRAQGKPVAYFCANLSSFLESATSSPQAKVRESAGDRAAKATLEILLEASKAAK